MWCKSDTPDGETGIVKLDEAILGDGGASIGKKALIVGEVVVGEEDRAEHFVGHEEVAEVAAAVAAGEAGAVFFDGPVVALVNFVAVTTANP